MSNKDKEKEKEKVIMCPVAKFLVELCSSRNSEFFEHLNKSKIEFFKAMRALIDHKIESLEKATQKKKATKIEVE